MDTHVYVVKGVHVVGIDGVEVSVRARAIGPGDAIIGPSSSLFGGALKRAGIRRYRGVELSCDVGGDLPRGVGVELAAAVAAALASQDGPPPGSADPFLFIGSIDALGNVLPCGAGYIAATDVAAGRRIVCCAADAVDVRAAGGDPIVVRDLLDALGVLDGIIPAQPEVCGEERRFDPCFSEVRGQGRVIEAVIEAVRRGDNIVLAGPPGVGRTMIARRIAGLITPTDEERDTLRRVASVSGLRGSWNGAPFRAPHHSVSDAGMFGGSFGFRPGEVSLATGGVLYLDQAMEFRASIIGALGDRLAAGEVLIRRGGRTVALPARPRVVVGSIDTGPNLYAPECLGTVGHRLAAVAKALSAGGRRTVVVIPVGLPEGDAPFHRTSVEIREELSRAGA